MKQASPPALIRPLMGWHLIMAAEIVAFHYLAFPVSPLSHLHIYRARIIISSFFIISGYKTGLQWIRSEKESWRRRSLSFLMRRLTPIVPWLLLMDPLCRMIALKCGSQPWMPSLWQVNPITYCWGVVWGGNEFRRYFPNEALWYISNLLLFNLLTPLLIWGFLESSSLMALAVWTALVSIDYSMWHLAGFVDPDPNPVIHQYIETNFVASPWHSSLVHYLLGLATAALAYALSGSGGRSGWWGRFLWSRRCDIVILTGGAYMVLMSPNSWRPKAFPKVDGQFRFCGVVALLLLLYAIPSGDASLTSRLLGARWMEKVAPGNVNLLTYISQVPIITTLLGFRSQNLNREKSNVTYLVTLWLTVLLLDRFCYSPLARISRQIDNKLTHTMLRRSAAITDTPV